MILIRQLLVHVTRWIPTNSLPLESSQQHYPCTFSGRSIGQSNGILYALSVARSIIGIFSFYFLSDYTNPSLGWWEGGGLRFYHLHTNTHTLSVSHFLSLCYFASLPHALSLSCSHFASQQDLLFMKTQSMKPIHVVVHDWLLPDSGGCGTMTMGGERQTQLPDCEGRSEKMIFDLRKFKTTG
uniref:Putative secreted protein n=1 Tax=Anopheles triannulatus TaxID=58253 RepID=A0A2M4B4T9_9DIPT